jgi:hypothetical protein
MLKVNFSVSNSRVYINIKHSRLRRRNVAPYFLVVKLTVKCGMRQHEKDLEGVPTPQPGCPKKVFLFLAD